MNPNWTKLAALTRTLIILGASSFCGAVVLPLATDGTLPTTWLAWRPILAVASSAAVAAEFIWIRTHIQQAAQAIGVLSNDPATTPAVKAALLKIGLGVLGLLTLGATLQCTPAQTAQAQVDTTTAIDLTNAICAVAADSPVGQPFVDVVCTLAEGGEQLVSVVIGAVTAVEGDGGTTTAMTTTASTIARVPVRQIRFSIPTATSAKFLATHAGKAKK
jgi:hypothetical protein